MEKKTMFTIGGIAAIVLGSVALFLGGNDAGVATEIVGATFILVGIIANLIRNKIADQ